MDADFASKSQKDLGMQVDRVACYVKQKPADAWVVTSSSREILEWFAGQPTSTIAMFGRHTRLPIAAAYLVMIPGLLTAVQRLIDLCYKRIG